MSDTLHFRVDDLDTRLRRIEAGEPAVQAERLNRLADEVKMMKRAFWALVITILTASVTMTTMALSGAFNAG